MKFVADPAKAASNRRDHKITLAEGVTVLDDPLGLERADDKHADRWVVIGESDRGRLLYVVYTIVTPALGRIISARRVTAHERRSYEEGDR